MMRSATSPGWAAKPASHSASAFSASPARKYAFARTRCSVGLSTQPGAATSSRAATTGRKRAITAGGVHAALGLVKAGGCARGLDAARKRLVRRARQEQAIELIWPGKDREAHVDGVGWSDLELLERVDARRSSSAAAGDEASNLLISGDNLVAMRALEEKYAGRVDLIYIDPPYSTGLSYYTQTELGERRAYRDDRAGGMVGYLDAMYLRLAGMHRLLSDDGKL